MCIAVPVEVLSVNGLVATVARAGDTLEVSLLLLGEDVRPGDYLVLQAHSHAVARLDAEEARALLELFAEFVPGVVQSEDVEDSA